MAHYLQSCAPSGGTVRERAQERLATDMCALWRPGRVPGPNFSDLGA